MPLFFHVDKARKLVMTTASGVVTRSDVDTHFQKLLKDPDFDPRFSELGDYTHLTKIDFTADDLRDFARLNVFAPSSRRAIVVGDDSTAVFAEMFALLRQVEGERDVRVFRTLEEGVDWILPRVPAR
jgi:hypothetical protein